MRTLWSGLRRFLSLPARLRADVRPGKNRSLLHLETLEERTLLSGVSTTSDLIAAINTANSSSIPSTIRLADSAVFNFASPNNFVDGPNALPVITSNITIVGDNDTFVRTSSTADRFFNVAGSGSLTLEHLTLQGGLAYGIGTAAEGGAIFSAGTLDLSGVTIQNNNARGANGVSGGLAGGDGSDALGGALYVTGGSVKLTSDNFIGNNAFGGNGGAGGAGYSGGDGGEGAGGGLFVTGGTVSMTNDSFNNNGAFGGAGGIGGDGETGGAGGVGGEGAGGGMFAALTSSFSLGTDAFNSNFAIGGVGGNGGRGGIGGNGWSGAGGNGGLSSGGGLHLGLVGNVTLQGDTFGRNEAVGGSGGQGGGTNGGAETGSNGNIGGSGGQSTGGGIDVEFANKVTLSSDTLTYNSALGGAGGTGGNGADSMSALHGSTTAGSGGDGGSGGFAFGGGLYVNGGAFTSTNDTLSDNQVQGGNGGQGGGGGSAIVPFFGGSAYAGKGGNGGQGGQGAGGGLYVNSGAVNLSGDTVTGNFVAGGEGGVGGIAGGIFGNFIGYIFAPAGIPGIGGNGGSALGGGIGVSANNTVDLSSTTVADNNLTAGTGGAGGVHSNWGDVVGANGSSGIASGLDVYGNVVYINYILVSGANNKMLTGNA